jgi:glycosyltransferase involved in cell wall biosynthesis
VVIPALEEEDNIGDVLDAMPKEVLGRRANVLVVDDGSADRTGDVAREHGAYVLRMPINSGQGSALKAGYHAALRLGAEVVITLDADGQNLPSEIELLAEPVLGGDADIVIGSRVLGEYEHSALVRTVGVYLFNWLLTVLTGTRITDCASSFRALSRGVLQAAQLKQEQYQSTEILIEGARGKFSITERPITWRRRQSGTTKKGRSLKYGFLFLRTIIKTWLR